MEAVTAAPISLRDYVTEQIAFAFTDPADRLSLANWPTGLTRMATSMSDMERNCGASRGLGGTGRSRPWRPSDLRPGGHFCPQPFGMHCHSAQAEGPLRSGHGRTGGQSRVPRQTRLPGTETPMRRRRERSRRHAGRDPFARSQAWNRVFRRGCGCHRARRHCPPGARWNLGNRAQSSIAAARPGQPGVLCSGIPPARHADEKEFLAECMQNANWLTRSLDQRARTILKVASEIVRQQDAFLVHGVSRLKPLNLRMVADAIGMHELTVSRVTANKYMLTPRGVFELRYFFNAASPRPMAGKPILQRPCGTKSGVDRPRRRRRRSSPTTISSRCWASAGSKSRGAPWRNTGNSMNIPSSVQRRREKRALAAAAS